MMSELTLEQRKSITENDIAKLEAQKGELQKVIDGLAKQSDELYLKRQKASQDFEQLKIAADNQQKAIDQQKSDLQKEFKRLNDENFKTAGLRDQLNQDKEDFKKEKSHFQEEHRNIQEDRKALTYKDADFNKKVSDLDKEKDELRLQLKETARLKQEFLQKEEVLKNSVTLSEAKNKELESAIFEANKKGKLFEERESELEKFYQSKVDSILKEKEAFSTEKEADEESLKNRELLIVRREKVLDQKEQEFKARLEQRELEESRKEQSEVKKTKKK